MAGATDSTAAKAEVPPPKDRARHGGRTGPRPGNAMALTIGQALQAHYDDLVAAPMPDRFLALLAELEAKEKSRG